MWYCGLVLIDFLCIFEVVIEKEKKQKKKYILCM